MWYGQKAHNGEWLYSKIKPFNYGRPGVHCVKAKTKKELFAKMNELDRNNS